MAIPKITLSCGILMNAAFQRMGCVGVGTQYYHGINLGNSQQLQNLYGKGLFLAFATCPL